MEKEKGLDSEIDQLFSVAENRLSEELEGITEEQLVEEQPIKPEDMPEELKVAAPAGQEDEIAFEEIKEEAIPTEPLEAVQIQSIIESLLLATDRPLTMGMIKEVFKGTRVRTEQLRRALDMLAVQYAGAERGIMLEEVAGGYQLRTKEDNRVFVRRMTKARPFRLSGPGLEVLAIIAYKQPITKHEVDEIRGVESGHLVRALMDRGIVRFDGKSDLPGKPMLYGTTRKFLEIFNLRDLRELPSLSEINELIPEGIVEEEKEKETLSSLTDGMSMGYEHDAERQVEYEKISAQVGDIQTTSDFFEKEKERQRQQRDLERADFIRGMMESGAEIDPKEVKWLERYEKALAEAAAVVPVAVEAAPGEEQPSEVVAEMITEDKSDASEAALDDLQERQMEKAIEDFESEDTNERGEA